MLHPNTVATRRRGPRIRILLVAVLVLAFTGAMASSASATLEIQSYNDPAGDATVQTYALENSDGTPRAGIVKNPFPLTEGERKSFGPPKGTYIWQATPAAGWKVSAINCAHVDPASGAVIPSTPGEFTVDVPNGRVTIVHEDGQDEYCAFTNRKASNPAPGGTGSSGVAPTLPGKVAGTALLRVLGGTHFAKAQVRIARQSVVRLQLLKGKKVVGTARYARKAGTPTLKVSLKSKYVRAWKHDGRKKVTLTLKITVVGSNRATKVFRYGVVVKI
jgi:hypothetical protein